MILTLYQQAKQLAETFMSALQVSEAQSRAYITVIRRGYRVSVVRLSDGMTKTGKVTE